MEIPQFANACDNKCTIMSGKAIIAIVEPSLIGFNNENNKRQKNIIDQPRD